MRDKAFRLTVLNGILFAVVLTTLQPGMVLSAFFLKLTNSTFYATLPLALMRIGSLWPQLLISNFAEAKERKKPFYVVAGSARVVFLTLMALTTYLLGASQPGLLALLVAVSYFSYSSGSGVCGIAFWDIIGKTIPATRRGKLMGLRGFYGGILGLASGFYVRHMLSDGGPLFPANYAWLFATAALFQCGTMLAFAAMPEPSTAVNKERMPFRNHLNRGLTFFRLDRDYRLFFAIRVLNSITMVGGMVFIPYAIKVLGMPESSVGVLMIVATCFALPSNFLWSHIGDRYGNRLLMLMGLGLYLSVPVIAFTSYYVPALPLPLPFLDGYDLRGGVFIVAFMVSAVALKGWGIGDVNYLLEIAPEESRPSYYAFMSVLLAPTAVVPLIGGFVAERFSFQTAFVISLVFGMIAYRFVLKLGEPRHRR